MSLLIYRGPGAQSGQTINVVLTVSSANRKIGALAQVWIVPHAERLILKDDPDNGIVANDDAVCGTCPLRANGAAGRMCYVNPLTAGTVTKTTYRKPDSAIVPVPISLRGQALGLRIGAYGDPAEIPLDLLEQLVTLARNTSGPSGRRSGQVGYTQHWRTLGRNPPHAKLLMASCFSVEEAAQATALGWRYYLVTTNDTEVEQVKGKHGLVACPNFSHGTTCSECMMCDGSDLGGPSIYHPVHGAGTTNAKASTIEAKMRRLRDALPVVTQ